MIEPESSLKYGANLNCAFRDDSLDCKIFSCVKASRRCLSVILNVKKIFKHLNSSVRGLVLHVFIS